MNPFLYKTSILLMCLASFYLHANPEYFLCIEGGGSKTTLQVIDQKGQIVLLTKNNLKNDKIETSGSNINLVGPEGIRQVLNFLFEEVSLFHDDKKINLKSIVSSSHVIAGMAGAGLPQNKELLTLLFQEKGLSDDHILVMSDAEIALQLMDKDGIVLIAGTGSVCFGKKDDTTFRVGGLGKVLGDEGSGYQIGLQALKAALSESYEWEAATCLTPVLKELFQTTDLTTLIPKINIGEITPSKIASSAPLVFNAAWEQEDLAARKIIDQAATDLSHLLTTMLYTSSLFNCEVHLYGGIFKTPYSQSFIEQIRKNLPKAHQNLKIINQSDCNPATLFAMQKIRLIKDLSIESVN